jgi:hypothetical protein
MKVTLQVQKDGTPLYEGAHDISDAESFGRACSQVWTHLRERKIAGASSVGALYEALDERLLGELDGASIRLSKPSG